jgi:glucosamine--fructose-6-phosphate aminotransferase (isomerizing)
VAATKTYLNTLASLVLLAAHMADRGEQCVDDLLTVIDQLEAAIPELEQRMPEVALPFSFVGRMFVIGRGVELSTAREIALKLLETCRIAAEPLTATDLAHGPVAALDPFFPVWAIASQDETLPAVVEAAARARETGATLVASGTAAEQIAGPDYLLPVPKPPTPLLAPLLSVVPGQLFAWALARAKRLDPDRPSGLSKVTFAR